MSRCPGVMSSGVGVGERRRSQVLCARGVRDRSPGVVSGVEDEVTRSDILGGRGYPTM